MVVGAWLGSTVVNRILPDAGSTPDKSWEMGTITLSPPSAVSKMLRSGHDGGMMVSLALEGPDLPFFALDLRPGAAFLGCCLSVALDVEAWLVVASLSDGERSTAGSSATDEGALKQPKTGDLLVRVPNLTPESGYCGKDWYVFVDGHHHHPHAGLNIGVSFNRKMFDNTFLYPANASEEDIWKLKGCALDKDLLSRRVRGLRGKIKKNLPLEKNLPLKKNPAPKKKSSTLRKKSSSPKKKLPLQKKISSTQKKILRVVGTIELLARSKELLFFFQCSQEC